MIHHTLRHAVPCARPVPSVRACLLALLTLSALSPSGASAQHLTVHSVPPGYTASSLELGQPFAGALAFDPADPNRLYAAVGFFGNMSVLRVEADTGTTATVAGPFGGIGGLALLANGDLIISENHTPGPDAVTTDTLIRARDLNADGDFLDPGELTELIAPILTGGNFTGAQIAVAPAGDPSGIPTGSLLVQTADGSTDSELLVVLDPESDSPAFRPAGGAYFSGFQYNGGFGFAPGGEIIHGESELDLFTFMSQGRIRALVNTNGDEEIDADESHVIVDQADLQAGLTDLTVSGDGMVFFGEGSGQVRFFALPADLLQGTATPAVFAETNSLYMSTVRLDRTGSPFGGTGAEGRLYLGGYVENFAQPTNLAVIEPAGHSGVADWAVYE